MCGAQPIGTIRCSKLLTSHIMASSTPHASCYTSQRQGRARCRLCPKTCVGRAFERWHARPGGRGGGLASRPIETMGPTLANRRSALRPLPDERFPYYEEAQRRVSRDGHIAVGKAFYSVPPEYLGQSVWVDQRSLCESHIAGEYCRSRHPASWPFQTANNPERAWGGY